MSQSTPPRFPCRTFLSSLVLCLPVALLYSQFLWNPVVFDDEYFFDGTIHNQYLDKVFSFDLRWLPYATLEWTRSLFGLDLIWFRVGNLALHLATTVALFIFLRRLFERIIPDNDESKETLSPHWLAFFGALIFALHPVSVYAAAYLVQRSTLMATLFALLTWRLFLEGLIRDNYRWLLASVVTYFLAVLSKEHAIMVPAVTIVLFLLINNQPIRQRLMLVWPTFVLYGLIGGFVVFQIKARHILGQAYEPIAANLMSSLGSGFDERLAYPLSMLTQSFLFFKYLWVWIAPSPAWMSVDIYQTFALRLWSWPEIAGLIGFVFYPIIAARLLGQRGINGLLGFSLLCPWLLFATELSTIRIQESFVLYRSYLWMAGAMAALPFLCQKLNAKQAIYALLFVVLFMMPLSWLRLRTFSHPLLLWDDAARLVEHNEEYYPGMERIFYNRGNAFNHQKQYFEAIEDYTKAIRLGRDSGYLAPYAYNNRGSAYLESHQYLQALGDFNKTIELEPKHTTAYLGKARALEALNQYVAAAQAYQQACSMGASSACQKTGQPAVPGKTLSEYLLQP
ncbi:tetratricopeptide repeat protein [Methylobacter tundripaludum]|uniref:Tetratricopeptide repeat protein n=1 Tax=Methylobacter tundripaludum TaxID=173365 RepID=A0A2S6H5L6_9GAMM|nr:tetratricopeptide repeat protein [Methylobacter tundripaludum]PPK72778.1 tetratricopeptide repeat protein [Methylobacter tundripaludum]